MSAADHRRAEDAILSRLAGTLPETGQHWLDLHLERCAECARVAASSAQMVRSLRAMPVTVRVGLVEATQTRLRRRAADLALERARLRPIWLACALSWAVVVVSFPVIWNLFAWATRQSSWSLISLFVVAWFVPGTVIALYLLASYTGREADSAGEVSQT